MDQVNQARVEMQNQIVENAQKMIWVTFQREGIHRYPAALEDPNLEDVKFLGYDHRHIFHFKIYIEVFHDDREIEFIQFKRFCEQLFDLGTLQLDYKSCEMISDDLYYKIAEKYPFRNVWISVSEDNENGSFIKYNKFNTK